MHPAYSVILFTTASGAGYGLLALMAFFAAAGALPPDRWLGVAAFGTALAMITFGLLSSTFHLGHPERAWRAFSQWRTSWLSREGVLSVATYGPALLFAWGWVVLQETSGFWRVAGLSTAALALLTVYSTAMIYASLRPVRAWFNPYTVFCYVVFAAWTGMLWLNFLAHAFGVHRPSIGVVFVLAGFATWFFKRRYWVFIDSSPPWVPVENATGLGRLGKVRLLDAPSTQETYVQTEMGYRVARKHATRLRVWAFVGYFAIPMAVGLATMALGPWLAIPGAFVAVISGMIGTAIERWLFFAEAKHTAALYFGAEDS